jgi:hypothetical protein
MQMVSHKKEDGAEIFTYIRKNRDQDNNVNKTKQNPSFEDFCLVYKHEMKEIYLLQQIATALQKMEIDKQKMEFLEKQINAFEWATNDKELGNDIKDEFIKQLKLLKTSYNGYIATGKGDWYSFELTLKHLDKFDLQRVKQMLSAE